MRLQRLAPWLPDRRWIVRAWVVVALLCGASLVSRWTDGLRGDEAEGQRAASLEGAAAGTPSPMTADDFRRMYEGTAAGPAAEASIAFP